jgi:hypothetical protein
MNLSELGGTNRVTGNYPSDYVPPKATFETQADKTLDKVKSIYSQRGTQYKDSFSLDCQSARLTTMSLDMFGLTLEPEQIRILQAAVLADIKDSRLVGKYNPDSLYDGIAYRALLTGLIEDYKSK